MNNEQQKEFKQRDPEFAMWEKKDKNGNTYYSIKTRTGEWVSLFRNRYKKSEKAPDFIEGKPMAPKQDFGSFNTPPTFNSSEDIPF